MKLTTCIILFSLGLAEISICAVLEEAPNVSTTTTTETDAAAAAAAAADNLIPNSGGPLLEKHNKQFSGVTEPNNSESQTEREKPELVANTPYQIIRDLFGRSNTCPNGGYYAGAHCDGGWCWKTCGAPRSTDGTPCYGWCWLSHDQEAGAYAGCSTGQDCIDGVARRDLGCTQGSCGSCGCGI